MMFVILFFRYQLIGVLVLFCFVESHAKNPLRAAAIWLCVISMAYPLFANIDILSSEATKLFREDSGTSMGAVVETVRSNVPVLSAIAISIRVMQSIFEPLVPAPDTYWIFEGDSISVLAIAYIISFFIMLPFWWRAMWASTRMLLVSRPVSRGASSLYALILIYVVLVGGFSFVHHRYLFPITALLMLGGVSGGAIKLRFEGGGRRS
jgi:hypothetical protein